jgi:hypothetical protein
MRYGTPDVLVGIGGAGKNIVYRLLAPSHEEKRSVEDLDVDDLRNWVIDEVIEPRGDRDHRSVKMDCFVVDTDTDEKRNDKPRCDRISELLQQRVKNHEASVTAPSIEYLNIAERARTDAKYLLNESFLNDIKRETGMSSWWLYDGPRMIDPMTDFGGGVIRRRAISKALYYTAQDRRDNPINDLRHSVDGSDDVGIVVGIGGGTGSGMFLDIARDLRSQGDPDITLFAVLPKFGEHEDTGANAYAALAELEYLALTSQNPFDNIVLLPYLDDASTTEFDEAIVRTLLTYYNLETSNERALMDESDDGRGPPRFAPFTIGATRLLQYEGAGLKETQDQFNEYYRQKRQLLRTESDLYDAAESLLEEHYSGDGDTADVYARYTGRGAEGRFSLDDEEVTHLYERIESLRRLVTLDVLPSIGCTIADDLSESFQSGRRNALRVEGIDDEASASGNEVRRAIVNKFPEQAMDPTGTSGSEADKPENEKLIELYEKEVEQIKRRRDLLRAKNMIEGIDVDGGDVMESEHISDALEQAFDGRFDGTTTGPIDDRLTTLDADIREKREKVDDLNTLTEALEGSEDEDGTFAAELASWRSDVEDDVETLESVYEEKAELETLLEDLEESIQGAVNAAHRAGDASEVPTAGPDGTVEFDRFDELQEKLKECGLDPIRESDVDDQVSAVWEARRAWLETDSGGFFGGPDVEDLQNRHTNHYRTVRNADLDLVWIPSWDNRSSESAKTRSTEFDERRNALEDPDVAADLVDTARQYVADPDQTPEELLSEETKSELNDSDLLASVGSLGTDAEDIAVGSTLERLEEDGTDVEDVLETLCTEGGAIYELFFDAFIGDVQTELETARENLEALETARSRYEATDEVVSHGASYAENVGRPGPPSEISAVEGDVEEAGSHITSRRPEDAGTVLANDDIDAAGFWTDETGERDEIDKILEDFTTDIQRSQLPVRNLTIDAPSRNPESPVYDEHRLVAAFLSRMFEQNDADGDDAVVPAVRDRLLSSIADTVSESNRRWRRFRFGGPWDLSMTMFFSGVMLDNLDLFHRGGNGYKDKYDRQRRPEDDSILIRHVHGIDGRDDGRLDDHRLIDPEFDGAYLYRESLLNLRADTDDKALVLNNLTDEDTLVRELLERYDITGFESTFDLGDDA